MHILVELDAVARCACRRVDCIIVEAASDKCRLRIAGAYCNWSCAGYADAGASAVAVAIRGNDRSHAHYGVVRCLVAELGVSRAAVRSESRNANLVEDFIRLKRGGEQVNEEVVDADGAMTAGGTRYEFGVERDCDRGQVARRVGVGQ